MVDRAREGEKSVDLDIVHRNSENGWFYLLQNDGRGERWESLRSFSQTGAIGDNKVYQSTCTSEHTVPLVYCLSTLQTSRFHQTWVGQRALYSLDLASTRYICHQTSVDRRFPSEVGLQHWIDKGTLGLPQNERFTAIIPH